MQATELRALFKEMVATLQCSSTLINHVTTAVVKYIKGYHQHLSDP